MHLQKLTYYVRGIGKVLDENIHYVYMALISKRRYFRAFRKNGFKKKYVVCYPEKPTPLHSLHEICNALGLSITTTPRADAVAFIHFEDTTKRAESALLTQLPGTTKIVNAHCTDISKEKVEEVFSAVFGYGSKVDPRTHHGMCVQKSDRNSANDGKIVHCPREPEDGYVYQKLIDTQDGDTPPVDIRLSIFNATIPFAFLRYKDSENRFNHTVRAVPVSVTSVISDKERTNIILFCRNMGFDYGELDILRDKHDKKLYILDANNTPWGPRRGHHVSVQEYERFIEASSRAFAAAFLAYTP